MTNYFCPRSDRCGLVALAADLMYVLMQCRHPVDGQSSWVLGRYHVTIVIGIYPRNIAVAPTARYERSE